MASTTINRKSAIIISKSGMFKMYGKDRFDYIFVRFIIATTFLKWWFWKNAQHFVNNCYLSMDSLTANYSICNAAKKLYVNLPHMVYLQKCGNKTQFVFFNLTHENTILKAYEKWYCI